jgi:phosphoesterase RecJ-like protein
MKKVRVITVMKRAEFKALSLDTLCEKLVCAKNPVIVMHRSPDGDAVGSAMALYHLFALLGKRAGWLCADKIPRRLEFLSLGCENKVYSDYSVCDLICVDVASPSQLGNLPERVKEASIPYLIIDHHIAGTVFADSYIKSDACATGEIIFDIVKALEKKGYIKGFTPLMINALYASISSDSSCFKSSSVTPHTHMVAAELLNMGANASEINRLLFDSKSEEILKAEGFALSKMKSFFGGRLNLVCITKKERDELGLELEFLETIIDVVRSLDGVEIAVAIKQLDDGTYKASMRSVEKDIATLCTRLGGGGHARAAGCPLSASSEKEAIDVIVSEVEKIL